MSSLSWRSLWDFVGGEDGGGGVEGETGGVTETELDERKNI